MTWQGQSDLLFLERNSSVSGHKNWGMEWPPASADARMSLGTSYALNGTSCPGPFSDWVLSFPLDSVFPTHSLWLKLAGSVSVTCNPRILTNTPYFTELLSGFSDMHEKP